MKILATILTTAALAASCGSSNESSLDGGSNEARKEFVSIQPIKGELVTTKFGIDPNSDKPYTDVTLAFKPYCTNELAPLSYEVVYGSKTAAIYVSAFEKVSKFSLTALCSEPKPVKKTIRIDRGVSKDKLTVVFNKGRSAKLPARLTGVNVTTDVRLGNVRSLCPQGVTCVTDGTVIDVVVGTNGCVDKAALSYSAVKNGSKLDLYVGALNLGNYDSRRVLCNRQNTVSFPITLNLQFYKKSDINLRVFKDGRL